MNRFAEQTAQFTQFQLDIFESALKLLDNAEVEVSGSDLAEFVASKGFDAQPNEVAYQYLTEVDGGYSEDEAREISWF